MRRLPAARGLVRGVALVVVIATAGCGARVSPPPTGLDVAASTQAAPSPLAPPEDGADGPAGVPAAPSAASPSEAASPTPAPSRSPSFGPRHNNGVVRLELSATCVRPGDLLIVTIIGPPNAGLGMVIGYSDHQAHGAMLTGETDAQGRYVWRVPVDPTVPDGEARVLVTSTGPNWKGEGGTADKTFRVSRGGC